MLEVIKKDFPEVEHTFATIGAGDWGTVRDGAIYVKLVEKSRRSRSQFEIQAALRRKLEAVPAIQPSIAEAGRMHGAKQLYVNIRGEELDLLKDYGAQLKAGLYQIKGVVDLEMTLDKDIPEYRLVVNRERAVDAGVMTQNIVRMVGAMVGGQAVSTYEDEDGDAVNVRVRLPEALRQDPGQVERLRLAVNRAGQTASLIPLGELVSYNLAATPSQIDRADLTRQVTLSANLEELAIGPAMSQIQQVVNKMKMRPGYRVVFSGEAEDMVESFGYMAEALFLAVILVYLILAAQFESFIDPLAIMFSLPLSIVGMAGMLALTKDTISIMSLIGLIMLMGLVTKNAILLVDFAKVLRSRGLERREAVITAGRTRLRPILMTTLAMIFGMLPLALGLGQGAEMRAPMGRAIIGGLITSTLLTLLVVPVIYTVLEDVTNWVKRRLPTPKRPPVHVPAAPAEPAGAEEVGS
jgi:HAE1 family hydrophobic/amphiphilic exporter-1